MPRNDLASSTMLDLVMPKLGDRLEKCPFSISLFYSIDPFLTLYDSHRHHGAL